MIEVDLRAMTAAEKKRERKLVIEFVARRDRGCQARSLVPEVECGGPHDPHEVIPRSAWRAGIYDRENVLIVCRAHHRWIDHFPQIAHDRGLHGYSWERPDHAV